MTILALIGVGGWGKNYLSTAATLDNVKIKYICTQTQKTLNTLPDTYIKTLSINDLLKNEDIDGFIIATPGTTHFAIAKQVLSAGRNVLIEKPLAATYNQALQLQKIWQIKKPKVLVGHLYLYNPAYRVFRKNFKLIREVKSIYFEGLSSPARKDVSVIWDWGPHPVSLILDLVKHPISTVSATASKRTGSNLYDTMHALIRFTNGIKAFIRVSWLGPHKVRKLMVEGKNDRLELDDTNTTNQKILLDKINMHPRHPEYKPDAALTEELMEFTKTIRGFKKITSDINMGVSVVQVLSAIEQSVESGGKPVELSFFS